MKGKIMELTDRDIDRIAERLFQKMRRLEERKLDIEYAATMTLDEIEKRARAKFHAGKRKETL